MRPAAVLLLALALQLIPASTAWAQAAPDPAAAGPAAAAAEPDDGFIRVPAGSFLMGSPEGESGRRRDEGPRREVRLSAYEIGEHEVTVAEFRDFVEATGYRTQAEAEGGGLVLCEAGWDIKADASWKKPYMEQDDRAPVVLVSWYDCVEYCNWRSKAEGLRPCYAIDGRNVICDWSANGYRLPTEAEWEYAAKGGPAAAALTAYSVYAGSADAEPAAWYGRNSARRTHPVGQKAANALGLHDMAGNACEWCWDWYGAYGASAGADPTGAGSGSFRVSRGGGWAGGVQSLRSCRRTCDGPDGRYAFLGFRLARRP